MVGPDSWINRGLNFRLFRHLAANAGSRASLDMAVRCLPIPTWRRDPRWRFDGMAWLTPTPSCPKRIALSFVSQTPAQSDVCEPVINVRYWGKADIARSCLDAANDPTRTCYRY